MKRWLAALAWLFCANASLAENAGDFAPGDTVCGFFNTYQPSTGASFTLASGAIRAYNVTSTTEDADDSGLTLDNDFDTVAGYHQVCVDTSADGTFYAAGNRYSIILDAGTVDSVSVVGTQVLSFGLQAGTPGDIRTDVAAVLVDTGTTLDDFLDTEVAAILSDTNAILVDTGTTLDDFLDTEIADIRRAIGPATTTIATLASQTSFTLTAGSADDNAYNGWGLIVVDASTATQTALGCVSDYTGSTKTVTLREDPAIFTMATTDNVILLPAFCTTGVDVSTIETVDATDQLDAHAAAGLDAAGVRAAVGLAAANLDTQLTNIDNFVDTEVADILTDTGTTLQGELDGIQTDTEDLQTRVPAALVGGRIDATVDGTGMEAGATAAIVTALEASTDLPVARYTNAAGDECTFVITEAADHIDVVCTEAP